MATHTFLNLPEEKKEAILRAAKNEFSSVPFSKASINRMIKDAGIPRGSFYMYFDDKMDMLMTLIADLLAKIRDTIFQAIQRSNGNLEATVLEMHDVLFHMYEDKENRGLMKNVLISIPQAMDEDLDHSRGMMPLKEKLYAIVPFLDPDQFAFSGEEEKNAIVDIVFSTLKTVLTNSIRLNRTLEESKVQLQLYLRIVKNGYLKKSEEV